VSRGRPKSGRRPLKRRGFDLWGTIGVVLGVLFFIVCIGYVVGAYYMVGIMAEIAQKDYTPANERISSYEEFFRKAEQHGLKVAQSPAYIKEGVKYFLWTISVPGRADKLVYRWKHDLETNRVVPLTSPATYVDVEMGYVRPGSAGLYPYESGDTVALQIAKGMYIAPGYAEESAEPEPSAEEEALPEEEVPAEEQAEPAEEATEEETTEEAGEAEGEAEEPPTEGESVDIGGETPEPPAENGAEEEPPEETPPDETAPEETPPDETPPDGGGDDAVPIG
jgi:hypothetical protein